MIWNASNPNNCSLSWKFSKLRHNEVVKSLSNSMYLTMLIKNKNENKKKLEWFLEYIPH